MHDHWGSSLPFDAELLFDFVQSLGVFNSLLDSQKSSMLPHFIYNNVNTLVKLVSFISSLVRPVRNLVVVDSQSRAVTLEAGSSSEYQFKLPMNDPFSDLVQADQLELENDMVVLVAVDSIDSSNFVVFVFPVIDALLGVPSHVRAEHDDDLRLVFPDHLPEFEKSVFGGALASDHRFLREPSHEAVDVAPVDV